MKITYEFDTNDENFCPDELKRIQKADDLCSCIWDIEQKLREWYKYDNRGDIPIEEVREEILSIIDEHGIRIDELWR